MDLWGALQYAMRTWRTGRIDPDEADRLVGGGTPRPEHDGLGVLIGAARAPATAGELAGERAAIAGFVAARRGVASTGPPRGRRHVRVPLSVGTVAMKVAAGIVVLTAGGTVLAAETGSLPAAAQQHAHRMFSPLGVPAPQPGPRPHRTGSGAGPSGDPTPGTPSSTPAPRATTTTPAASTPLGLCRAWDAARDKPHGKAMTPAARKALKAAAGRKADIAAYCAKVLAAGEPSANTSAATATPSHPGNRGKGKGKTRPTPGPHG